MRARSAVLRRARRALGSLLLAATLHGGCARPAPPTVNGAPPPAQATFRDVVVQDMNGQSTRFGDAVGHRPALISFWAPWCDPCVREQPALQRLATQAAACGAGVVGVAVGETRQTVAAFTRARALDFPQLTDPEFHLADALGQRRIPATLVLDANQAVVFTGESLDEGAVAALRSAIARGNAGAD